MKKFIIIDNSIVDVGGHYYEYAMHVAKAADEQGFQPVLATNRRFKVGQNMTWKAYPVYKYAFYLRTSEPCWFVLAKKIRSHISNNWFRFKTRFVFSHLGFWGIIRHEISSYLQNRISTERISPLLLLLSIFLFFARIFRSLGRFCIAAIPFKKYFKDLFYAFKEITISVFGPFLLLIRKEDWVERWLYEREKRRQFAKDTLRLFHLVHLEEGDIVFIPTVSSTEMMSLISYFNTDKRAVDATWHLLFRRNIYTGRNTDYNRQEEDTRPLRNAFKEFESKLNGQKVFFYTDTNELTDQYNRLAGPVFNTAPIPHTYPADLQTAFNKRLPLRVVYAGDARSEKGYHHLPKVVQDLWNDYVLTGKIIFTFQSNYNIPEGEPEAVVARGQLESFPHDKVRLIKEPMASKEYSDFMQSADIIILPYDRDNYYARSSGILVEALTLGCPVIVPSSTWMARQIADEIYDHHDYLKTTMPILNSVKGSELQWKWTQQPTSAIQLTRTLVFGGHEASIYSCIEVPDKSTHLIFSFDQSMLDPGIYISVYIEQYSFDKQSIYQKVHVVGEGINGCTCSVCEPLNKNTRTIRLRLSNSFSNNTVELLAVSVDFIQVTESESGCPLGAVGLAYNQPSEISWWLANILDNYDHYKETALAFAKNYYAKHNSTQMVNELAGAIRETSMEEVLI